MEESMDVAKNNVGEVGNNYLKNRHFLYKMSLNEIVGISAYMAEKAWPIMTYLLLMFGQ
jgi:hypothetical protein